MFGVDTFEDEEPTVYHMHDPYEPERLMRWLTNFDDKSGEEATIIPLSSLPKPPGPSKAERRPESFHEILLSDKSLLPESARAILDAEKYAEKTADWTSEWAQSLRSLKKKQHRSSLLKHGVHPTPRLPVQPTTWRTKKAKEFRALMAKELFSGSSIGAFMELPVMERLATYHDKLEAPGMIELSDPSTLDTELPTHCISSVPNQHARSFLAASALNLLPPTHRAIWHETQRHFWRNNVFVVNVSHLKAVLNGLDARVKSSIAMLHVDLEVLDDLDGIARYSLSCLDDNTNSKLIQTIRQQNQDLSRLMQECYELSWVRIHVHSEWMKGDIHDVVKAHRVCQSFTDQHRCRHIVQYDKLCMNTQRRVEYLTWLLCKSLKCKENTVFIDVEHLCLDGTTKVLEVKFDHAKLDKADKEMRAICKGQRTRKKTEQHNDSRAPRVPSVKKFRGVELIDLT